MQNEQYKIQYFILHGRLCIVHSAIKCINYTLIFLFHFSLPCLVCWCVKRICLFEVLLTALQNHFLWSTLLKLVFRNPFYTIPILLPLQKILLAWGFFSFFQSCCQGADCFWLLKSKLPENGLFKLKSIYTWAQQVFQSPYLSILFSNTVTIWQSL